MLFVWIFLVLGAFFIIALVDFVLRNPMFGETFVIKIGIPFTQIEYTKENVEFIYLIAGSLLLGALIIAVSTLVLDAKRKLKVRSLRKELKNLQKAVEEAHASLPQKEEEKDDESTDGADTEEQTESSEASLSPEEITKSFEDAVEGGDFLEKPPEEEPAEEEEVDAQPAEEEEDAQPVEEEEIGVQFAEEVEEDAQPAGEEEIGVQPVKVVDAQPAEEVENSGEAESLPQVVVIEAEVMDSDEQAEKGESASDFEEEVDKKKESDHV